jgi:acyl-CoA synthetase (AMP-forming)/AMP-acid ligase II
MIPCKSRILNKIQQPPLSSINIVPRQHFAYDIVPRYYHYGRPKARQGFHHHVGIQDIDVKSPTTMESLPHDGQTIGEVMFRGNTVMSGYYKDINATKESMVQGWLHTGDLAVRHPAQG